LWIAVSEPGHHEIVNTRMLTVYVPVIWGCADALICGHAPRGEVAALSTRWLLTAWEFSFTVNT
jgi:hypothetical protein